MVPRRLARYTSLETRARVGALASVAADEWMQDWPLEVSDPSRLNELVVLLQSAENDDDRFALMQLVLCSLDEADPTVRHSVWPAVQTLLERSPGLHAHDILYWSLGDETDDGVWVMEDLSAHGEFALTYLMRDVLIRVAAQIGVRLA